MKNLSIKQCQPTPGALVAAFCAGMRGAAYSTESQSDLCDYRDGLLIGRRLPRRLAKRRATRIAREYRAEQNKSASRGHMVSVIAKARVAS